MDNVRVGGILFLKANGTLYRAKGAFTYNLGKAKREAVVGADTTHGFKEVPQTPFIEGACTDSSEFNLANLLELRDATVTLEIANGKIIVLQSAWYAGDGNVTSEEGEITVRFEGLTAEEVRA